jgi:hypothetical protein
MMVAMYKHIYNLTIFFCGRIYILQRHFPKAILQQLNTTVTDLNDHHQNFQKGSWLRVPHSCHKRNMLLLRPVEGTPALPAAIIFKNKSNQE